MKKIFLSFALFAAVMQGSVTQAQDDNVQNVITFDIGDAQISVLTEEHREGRSNVLTGATPEMLQKYLPNGTYPTAVNAWLIRTQDKNILVDAGYGRKLFDNLQLLGVAAQDIDVVLLTHMHGDHIGGLLKDEKVTFPKAELYLAQPEHDYWTSDREMQSAAERRNGFLQARKVIAAYRDRLHLFVPDDLDTETPRPLLPGIRAVAAYGHTPGHTAYLLESGNAKLLIWGDLTHAMNIQMPVPEVALAFDVDVPQAVETRKRILQYVSAGKIPVAGMHVPFPGIGNVLSIKNGEYAFEPYCLCLGI
jgi:glyoxylase-like metal-dependent hydrolase (beta-lactamase superfamily II)